MRRFRISDPVPVVLDIDITFADIMGDLDPDWLAEYERTRQ